MSDPSLGGLTNAWLGAVARIETGPADPPKPAVRTLTDVIERALRVSDPLPAAHGSSIGHKVDRLA